MHSITKIKRQLEYVRFTHLAWMYIIALLSFLFSTIPHRQWIFLAVLVICAGIEPGLIVKRSLRRIKGTMAALLLMIPVLYLVQLNYRFIPLLLIGSAILMVVTGMNREQYSVKVFFTTFFVFLLTALTTEVITAEGPLEMVLNRAICTLIGVAIILSAEYFLFNSYNYGYKLYFLHQLQVYDFLAKKIKEMTTEQGVELNQYTYVAKLRDQTTEIFATLANAAENLRADLNTPAELKQHIESFQKTATELRCCLFAICFARFNLHSAEDIQKHLLNFDQLMHAARAQFIQH